MPALVPALVIAALVLAGIDLALSRFRSLVSWAVVLLALAMLVPVFAGA